jgi:hypothetical protein
MIRKESGQHRQKYQMATKVIRYQFRLPDGSYEDFRLQLNTSTLELEGNVPESLPQWTELAFHQCPNCPLDNSTHPHCPLAANIVSVVQRFEGLISHDKIRVDVTTDERRITQYTTAQIGISSIMGLVIATCGCPHTAFFKPMAWFHLPMASEEETIFRATSMYLLAQYYLKKEGRVADFEFEGLSRIYRNIQIINVAVSKRLREATMTDSSLNAIVILDNFAQTLPLVIEESLEEIRHLFSTFFR